MNQDLYLFSGLGANKSIFQRLDLSGYSVNYIEWIVPLDCETIEHYASRLLSQITAPKPTLIGAQLYTGDRILPIRFLNSDIVVKEGGHFMTLNKSDEINRILRLQLG